MEDASQSAIEVLRHSQQRLRALAEPLSGEQLRQESYDPGWPIAQVLSHLGSQAEIFNLYVEAAVSNTEPPGPEAFGPIWDAWNALTPELQAADGLRRDRELVARLEELSREDPDLRLKPFGMDLSIDGLARMRLGEHAVHTWDIAVVLDPDATVAADAVELLVDNLGPLAERTGRSDTSGHRTAVTTSAPDRHFTLELGEKVSLQPSFKSGGAPALLLPAEALVRLIYGRLDPDHTPPVEMEGVDLHQLRSVFPGF